MWIVKIQNKWNDQGDQLSRIFISILILPADNLHMSRKVFRAASIQAIIPLCITNFPPYKPDQVNKVLMM